jgi:hypothetical protein
MWKPMRGKVAERRSEGRKKEKKREKRRRETIRA